MKTGIYKIVSPDGSVYIGQSIDIEKRIGQHKLNRYKGLNKLKKSLDYYGPYNHRFEILEECLAEELNFKESYWIEFYRSSKMLNSISAPSGVRKERMNTKNWIQIPNCSNYLINIKGIVKRKKHKANGNNYKILKEMNIKIRFDRYMNRTIKITSDEGKQVELSINKLLRELF